MCCWLSISRSLGSAVCTPRRVEPPATGRRTVVGDPRSTGVGDNALAGFQGDQNVPADATYFAGSLVVAMFASKFRALDVGRKATAVAESMLVSSFLNGGEPCSAP